MTQNLITAGTSTSPGIQYTGGNDGTIAIQSGSTPTTAVTIDASQNVGIGITPSSWSTSGYPVLQMKSGSAFWTTTNNGIVFSQNLSFDGTNVNYLVTAPASFYQQYNGTHIWKIAPSGTAGTTATMTQAMTLDANGRLVVGGTTVLASANFTLYGVNNNCSMFVSQPGTSSQYQIGFGNDNGGVGQIVTSGSSTAYQTSSDRRLKSNIADLTTSGAIIDALQPRTFTWNADNSADVGFIADEIQAVVPKAVTGAANAVDADGKPVYQMLDASTPEMIAYLVAEVKSLRARLKAANIA